MQRNNRTSNKIELRAAEKECAVFMREAAMCRDFWPAMKEEVETELDSRKPETPSKNSVFYDDLHSLCDFDYERNLSETAYATIIALCAILTIFAMDLFL